MHRGIADLDAQMVVLGSGDPQLERTFQYFASARLEQFGYRDGYNEGLAHRIEAGSDMFLMPSRYEPCGLNQIYSLRYGTVPIVRATGGLDDTVEHWNAQTQQGTGFKFYAYTGAGLLGVVQEALEKFHDQKAWRTLMTNGMGKDFSWLPSAREYVRGYERIRQLRGLR